MFGRTTVAAAIDRFYTTDVWMHSWDLGRALGQHPDLGEERCAAAFAAMEPNEEMLRESGQFGSASTCRPTRLHRIVLSVHRSRPVLGAGRLTPGQFQLGER